MSIRRSWRTTVFNYPTLAECYKVAAFNAANKLALTQQARGAVAPSIAAHLS